MFHFLAVIYSSPLLVLLHPFHFSFPSSFFLSFSSPSLLNESDVSRSSSLHVPKMNAQTQDHQTLVTLLIISSHFAWHFVLLSLCSLQIYSVWWWLSQQKNIFGYIVDWCTSRRELYIYIYIYLYSYIGLSTISTVILTPCEYICLICILYFNVSFASSVTTH